MMVLGRILARMFGNDKGLMIVALCWMVAFAATGSRMIYWECPRCGKWFHAKWWASSPFTSKCVHCGLPKWAGADAEGNKRAEDF